MRYYSTYSSGDNVSRVEPYVEGLTSTNVLATATENFLRLKDLKATECLGGSLIRKYLEVGPGFGEHASILQKGGEECSVILF